MTSFCLQISRTIYGNIALSYFLKSKSYKKICSQGKVMVSHLNCASFVLLLSCRFSHLGFYINA